MPSADPEIVELNLLWLIKARELARMNREKAVVVLGIDIKQLESLSMLSLGDLITMAESGVMQFQPRFRSVLFKQFIERGNSSSLSARLHTLLIDVVNSFVTPRLSFLPLT